MSQEWIDQLNEEFEQLSINDSIRMENARIERAKKETQKEFVQTLLQSMSIEQVAKVLQKSVEDIKSILEFNS